ncbi:MAG: AAA family ATPase [Acidobacteriota bacterium]|nr:AAA family ATPase [Acidobacteriota bacterium]
MKIRKLQLKNIGVFDDETIEFQPCPVKDKAEIHILTGQNGSGKTTILMALANSFTNFSTDTVNKSLYKRLNYKNKRSERIEFEDFKKYFCRLKVGLEGNAIIKLDLIEGSDFSVYFSHGDIINEEIKGYLQYIKYSNDFENLKLSFAPFAFSGYRHIQSERIEAIKEPKDFNPLSQSLEFVKDYNQENQLTINQLIANNISKSAIEKGRNEEKSKRFANVIDTVEKAIFDITNWKIEFDIETEPTKLIIKINGEELDFDGLPDGLRSLISWIADLLGRVDLLKWQDDLPIFEKNLILFLDEIEVHLHPAWQRKVLPVVQKLFKNSQIFVSTHSPFVVNSVDDAWVYKLELENGKARVAEIVESENSNSITQVLREVFGIEEWFGLEVQNNFERFKELKNKIISNGADENIEKELLEKGKILADEPNDQLKQIIRKDLEELSEIKNKPYTL